MCILFGAPAGGCIYRLLVVCSPSSSRVSLCSACLCNDPQHTASHRYCLVSSAVDRCRLRSTSMIRGSCSWRLSPWAMRSRMAGRARARTTGAQPTSSRQQRQQARAGGRRVERVLAKPYRVRLLRGSLPLRRRHLYRGPALPHSRGRPQRRRATMADELVIVVD